MRTYKPVRPKARRGRMLRAVRMHAEGMPLRDIAKVLEISHETVRRDLAAWDAEQATVSHLPVTFPPPGGGNVTAECDSGEVIPLRRNA
jgi:predicted ArsR family transcriptional regulator